MKKKENYMKQDKGPYLNIIIQCIQQKKEAKKLEYKKEKKKVEKKE